MLGLSIRFVDWPNRKLGHITHTLEVIEWLMARYHKQPNFFGIELLNEPTSWSVPLPILQSFYEEGYHVVRKYSPTIFVILAARVGAPLTEWHDFMADRSRFQNVMLDVHMYQVHDRVRFGTMSAEDHIRFAKHKRLDEIRRLGQHPNLLTLVGEWSASLPKASEPSDDAYLRFTREQMASFGEATGGWFFWSYKIERPGYKQWSFQKSIEASYLPPSIAPTAKF
jgi:aryl-phospho-beta-D-glucosidase BglC (GH1 family)